MKKKRIITDSRSCGKPCRESSSSPPQGRKESTQHMNLTKRGFTIESDCSTFSHEEPRDYLCRLTLTHARTPLGRRMGPAGERVDRSSATIPNQRSESTHHRFIGRTERGKKEIPFFTPALCMLRHIHHIPGSLIIICASAYPPPSPTVCGQQ